MSEQILIVGGGIVGLSTAHWLIERGASVTLVERGPIPCPLASSTDHHRMIRMFYGSNTGYGARMPEALRAWRALWSALPGSEGDYYAATGVLALSQTLDDYTDISRKAMEQVGVPFERLTPSELASRFAFLDPSAADYGLLAEGGALMSNRIMIDLAHSLRGRGATMMENSYATEIDPDRARVTLADGRGLEADRIIVAAGVDAARLCPWVSVPLLFRRSVIVYADPPPDLRGAWAQAPCWNDFGGDSDLWGIAPVQGLPVKLGDGALGSSDPDDSNREITKREIDHIMAAYRPWFRDIDRFNVRWGQANYWTLAPEYRFVLQQEGRALLISACSGHGFKFGALTGRDIAEHVTGELSFEVAAQRIAGR